MKLDRTTLSAQIAAKMLQYIQEAGLPPGASLPSEADLVADFEVSRPIVREALKYLEGRGIIDVASGKSATLRPIDEEPLNSYFQIALILDKQTLVDLMEIREGLEVQSAMLAADRCDSEAIGILCAVIGEMRETILVHDMERFVELDARFHELIAEFTSNKMLTHVIKSIRQTSRNATFELELRQQETVEQLHRVLWLHEQILDAIADGKGEVAAVAMRRHFRELNQGLFEDR